MGIRAYIRFCFDRPKSFWFGLSFTGFSIFFMVMMGSFISLADLFPNQPDYEELSVHGEKGLAKVDEIDTVRNVTINGEHPTRIVYSFADTKGSWVKDTVETMEPLHPELGSQVPVRFSGTDSALEGFPPYYFPMFIFILMPGIFALFGLPFLAFSLAGAKRKIGLYQSGEIINGKLLAVTPIYMGFLPFVSTRFIVAYSYSPNETETYQTNSIISDLGFINEKRTGDSIEILFDRRNPKNSCVKEK